MAQAECEIIRVDFENKQVVSKNTRSTPVSPLNKNKLETFSQFVDQDLTTLIIDTLNYEVQVPDSLQKNPAMQLNWSHKFQLPDFEYDENGVQGTLTFNQQPFFVVVPWESVRGMFHPRNAQNNAMWLEKPIEAMNEANDGIRQVLGANLKPRARKAVLKGFKKLFARRAKKA